MSNVFLSLGKTGCTVARQPHQIHHSKGLSPAIVTKKTMKYKGKKIWKCDYSLVVEVRRKRKPFIYEGWFVIMVCNGALVSVHWVRLRVFYMYMSSHRTFNCFQSLFGSFQKGWILGWEEAVD